jgi:hypothetical protein
LVADTVNITTLPIYSLEPNTLIKVENDRLNGKYLVTRFSIPLAHGATTQLTTS